jgi:hypothetical protein
VGILAIGSECRNSSAGCGLHIEPDAANMLSVMTIIEYLQGKLREAGPKRFHAIAAATGVSESLLPKLAYGMRDNPRLQTIQPLLDYFNAIDRGELSLPDACRDRQAA